MSFSSLGIAGSVVAAWLLPSVLCTLALVVTQRARPSLRRGARLVCALTAVGYLVAVAAITLWPFRVNLSPDPLLDQGNWKPFEGTLGFLLSDDAERIRLGARDFAANVLLFFPLGLLATTLTRRLAGIVVVLGGLGLVALGLEVVQGVTIAGRTLDVDDAIAGGVGVLAGAVAAAVVRPLTRGRATRRIGAL